MAATATAPALAQADPGRMFMINAVTPGVVSYSGEGTAQFNNSSTTSNAFSVGSSSNFGVNASVSSTNDYLVDANALFKLADSSQLQQTIGTSSSAANTQAASESSAKAADTVANSAAQTEFGDSWSDFQARQGVTPVTGTGALTTGIDNPTGGADIKTESAYLAAKKEFTQSTRAEAFSDFATTANNSSSSASGGQGIIEGNFLNQRLTKPSARPTVITNQHSHLTLVQTVKSPEVVKSALPKLLV